jgi:hypothetical protein
MSSTSPPPGPAARSRAGADRAGRARRRGRGAGAARPHRRRAPVGERVDARRRDADDPEYWQDLFERNATAVLDVLPKVHLAAGHALIPLHGRRDGDLLVRPFVTEPAAT